MLAADGPLTRLVGQDPGGVTAPPGSVFHARLRTRRPFPSASASERRQKGFPAISTRVSLPSLSQRKIVTRLTPAMRAASSSVTKSLSCFAMVVL